MWSWFEGPDNRLRLARFGAAMTGLRNMTPEDAILDGLSHHHHPTACFVDQFLTWRLNPTGYAWGKLPPGSLVVDVGGGLGSQSLTLARRHPDLRFVVQDREAVVGDANEVRCPSVPIPYILLPDASLTQYWKKNMPDALDSGRVKLQGQSSSILALSHRRALTFGFLKASVSLTRSPHGRKKSQFSSSARSSTIGLTNTASRS